MVRCVMPRSIISGDLLLATTRLCDKYYRRGESNECHPRLLLRHPSLPRHPSDVPMNTTTNRGPCTRHDLVNDRREGECRRRRMNNKFMDPMVNGEYAGSGRNLCRPSRCAPGNNGDRGDGRTATRGGRPDDGPTEERSANHGRRHEERARRAQRHARDAGPSRGERSASAPRSARTETRAPSLAT